MLRRILTIALVAPLVWVAGCGGGGGGDLGGGGGGGGGGQIPAFDLYVDAVAGSDANPGTQALPLKTLTAALGLAKVDDKIKLAPGTYDPAHGELFPLTLPAGVAIEGDVPNRGGGATPTLLAGSGSFPLVFPDKATVVMGEGTVLRGVRISTAGAPPGSAALVIQGVTAEIAECTLAGTNYMGVYFTGAGTSQVHHCSFEGGSYGCYIAAPTEAIGIHDCTFVSCNWAIDIVGAPLAQILDNLFVDGVSAAVQVQSGTPLLQGNTFSGAAYVYAAIITSGGKAVVRANTFSSNKGVSVSVGGDIDLGTAATAGGNDFAGVAGIAVQHAGPATIQAQGNTWQHAPPTAGQDIVVTGAGSVVYGPGANDKVP